MTQGGKRGKAGAAARNRSKPRLLPLSWAGELERSCIVRRLVMAVSGLLLVAALNGCVTKAAGRAIEAPGHIVGGLLGG